MADPYDPNAPFAQITNDPNIERAPVRAAISSADARAAQLDIAQQREDLQEERFGTDYTMKVQKSALDQAKGYYDIAKNLTDMHNETQQHLDSADFLSELNNISHNDPQFEMKVNALQAKYPLAPGDPNVTAAMAIKEKARGNFTKGMEAGGAFEFEQGSPAFQAFQQNFHQTGDPIQARAHAKATQEGEEQVRKAIADGTLTPDDIYSDVTKGEVKPELHDEQGNLHYHKLLGLSAQRAGEIKGAPQKLEDRQAATDQDLIVRLAGKAEDLKDTDPATYQLYQNAVRRRNAYDAKKAATGEGATPTPVDPISAYGNF